MAHWTAIIASVLSMFIMAEQSLIAFSNRSGLCKYPVSEEFDFASRTCYNSPFVRGGGVGILFQISASNDIRRGQATPLFAV
jgi:hypothetical protein